MGKFEPELWVWLGVNIIVIGLIIVGIIAIVGWLRKTTQKFNQTDSNVQSPTELTASDSNPQSPTEPLPLRLAQQENAQAQNHLGMVYRDGTGVTQDYAEAVNWFREAADQGDADAQNNLGLMYANGKGVVQDYAEAMKWFRKAADQGDAKAQNNLGALYHNKD